MSDLEKSSGKKFMLEKVLADTSPNNKEKEDEQIPDKLGDAADGVSAVKP